MAINMQIAYSLTLVGDGVTTTFSFDLTKSSTFAPSGSGLTTGGIELGVPVGLAGTNIAGASVSLNGRTVTLTFNVAPTNVSGAVFVLY
jgi:hypothetical protein